MTTTNTDLDSWAQLLEGVAPLTSALFEDTRAYLKEHGWTQSVDVRPDGRVCLAGAVGKWAYVGEQPRCRDVEAARSFSLRGVEAMELMGIDNTLFGSPVAWNDHAGRTVEEVDAALARAAQTLREQGR